MPDQFELGSRVHWNDGREIKVCIFRGMQDSGTATIAFGKNSYFEDVLWDVPIAQLSKPAPPINQYPAFLPGQPTPPAPEVPLEVRRQHLATALSELHRATEAVATATSAANRAQRLVMETHARLRTFNDLEAQATEKLVADLVSNGGSTEPHDQAWADRQLAQRNASIAESAYAEIARKLSEAKNAELACRIQVHKTASRVAGAVLDAKIAALASLELQAAEERKRIKSMIGFHFDTLEGTPQAIPISSASGSVIHNPPVQIQDPIGHDTRAAELAKRQAPIAALYDRLIRGEVESDFQ